MVQVTWCRTVPVYQMSSTDSMQKQADPVCTLPVIAWSYLLSCLRACFLLAYSLTLALTLTLTPTLTLARTLTLTLAATPTPTLTLTHTYTCTCLHDGA